MLNLDHDGLVARGVQASKVLSVEVQVLEECQQQRTR